MSTVEQRVVELISKCLLVDEAQITRSASLSRDLHADSLDAVELILALEDRFGIEIPDEDAERLRTVEDVIEYVEHSVMLQGRSNP